MSEWDEIRLGDLCTFISRGITPQYVDVGTPVINQKCIRNNKVDLSLCKFTDTTQKIKNEKYVEYGDILINSTGAGTLGRVAIYKHHLDSVSADGHVTILHTKGNVNSAYLGYYLHSIEPLIENLGRGSTNQMELSPTDLKRIKIVLPFLDTQKRIADILSAYDDLIENNNRRIALLEKAAQELYKEWFVRFRFPGYENAKFENGLPEGWKRLRFRDIAEIGRGSSPRPISDQRYFENGSIPWIKIADATSSKIYIHSTKEYVNNYGASFSRKLPIGSLILAASGTLGFPMFLAVEGCIHDGWLYFSNFEKIFSKYIYYVLMDLREVFNNVSYGAAIQNINTEIVRKSNIIAPDDDILSKFTCYIEEIHNEIISLQKKNQNLAKQRDLLLPRLMSGKLEV